MTSLRSGDQSCDDDIPLSQDVVEDSEVAEIIRQQGRDFVGMYGASASISNLAEAQLVLAQDFLSSIFIDEFENIMGADTDGVIEGDTIDNEASDAIMERASQRGGRDRNGGFKDWSYAAPFRELIISIDTADRTLGERFVMEANEMLRNVVIDVQSNSDRGETVTAKNLSRMDMLDTFLPHSVLEKLRITVNRVLGVRQKEKVSTWELKGVFVLHVLAASYNSSVQTITNQKNREFFYQIGLCGDRYSDIWSALSCTTERRGRVESSISGWSNKPTRGNAMITELEQELAAVNRGLLYVPGVTVFSLDDDHQRLRSRAVAEMTNLSHINNPQKALGPVNNALCSALTAVNLASHYSRAGEKTEDVWERLVQLLQGAPTTGSLQPMTDAIFAADRGYNSKSTIDFLNDRIGATGIGTHKRSLDYPFVFGDGPIRKKHKGMIVNEKGTRAIYSATRKGRGGTGRKVEAVVYRESFSGRIAALYHNDSGQFGADKFILIPKSPFRSSLSTEQVEELQVLFHRNDGQYALRRRTGRGGIRLGSMSLPSLKVVQVLHAVHQFTILQSEDPGWFLARAFQFTSRTTHGFYVAIASDFTRQMKILGSIISGRALLVGAAPLPSDSSEAELQIKQKWESVLSTINIKCKDKMPQSRSLLSKDAVLSATEESLDNLRKADLLIILEDMGHRQPSSLRKSVLVQNILQLKADVIAGIVALTIPEDLHVENGDVDELQKSDFRRAMYEKSLDAWVMKPLISTRGMKEGSFNETQVLKALPQFCEEHKILNAEVFESGLSETAVGTKLTIEYVRCVGLIGSKNVGLLADSPDGLAAVSVSSASRGISLPDLFTASVEVKTVTAPGSIASARERRDGYAPFIFVEDIGINAHSRKVFLHYVWTPEYRTQCIHHATTLEVKYVLFVCAKGSNCGIGQIIYAALLEFSSILQAEYSFCISTVRVSSFEWIGKTAQHIPEQYDSMLKSSHASDLHSFASFYNLSRAYKQLVATSGPLPPARMIRPAGLVYWNHLKGGVDEFSRALQSLAYTNSSESPIVSIIGRLLCIQVNNAAVLHRLSLAKAKGALPDLSEYRNLNGKGYNTIRNAVSSCCSFADFARKLAKEFK